MGKFLRIGLVFISIALVLFSSLALAEKAVAPAGKSNASQQIPLINATRNTANLNNLIELLQNVTMQLNNVTKQLENATMSSQNITKLENATKQLQGAAKQVQGAANPFAKVKGKKPNTSGGGT
jgi:exonuclease VII small subunit